MQTLLTVTHQQTAQLAQNKMIRPKTRML